MDKVEKRTELMQKTLVVWLGAMICCGLWGSAYPCIKIGYEMLAIHSTDSASQLLFAGCRFTLAGILSILLGSLLNGKFLFPEKSAAPHVLVLSMLQTVIQYVFFYIGLAHTTGVKSSILGGFNVFISILVASLLFSQEALTARKLLGCAVGFAGIVLVNLTGNGFDMDMNLMGDGFILLSTTAYAFSSVFMKRYSARENPVMLSGYQFLLGGVILVAGGFLGGGRVSGFSLGSTLLLLYMALISAVAYSLWGTLLKYNPVSRVAIFGFMNPIFGVVLSAWLLGEAGQAFGLKSLAALVLVCVGICIVNYRGKKKAENLPVEGIGISPPSHTK